MRAPRYRPRVGDLVHLVVGFSLCIPAVITKAKGEGMVNLVSFLDPEEFYTKAGLEPLAAAGIDIAYRAPGEGKRQPSTWHYAHECNHA